MAKDINEVFEELKEIIAEETGIDSGDIELEKSFSDDLDIDSISMITIVAEAEEKFGVSIPDDQISKIKTVKDAVDFIANAAE